MVPAGSDCRPLSLLLCCCLQGRLAHLHISGLQALATCLAKMGCGNAQLLEELAQAVTDQ